MRQVASCFGEFLSLIEGKSTINNIGALLVKAETTKYSQSLRGTLPPSKRINSSQGKMNPNKRKIVNSSKKHALTVVVVWELT